MEKKGNPVEEGRRKTRSEKRNASGAERRRLQMLRRKDRGYRICSLTWQLKVSKTQ